VKKQSPRKIKLAESERALRDIKKKVSAWKAQLDASPPARGRKRAAATKPATKKTKPAAKPPTGRAKATRGRAAAGDDSGDDVDEIIAPSRRGTRGTQNTSTQGTQNTWGRSRRSSGA